MGFELPGLRNRRIRRAAARWRVEMLEPHSPELRAAFEMWRAADPAHAKAYGEIERITGLAERLPSGHRRQAPIGRERLLRPAFAIAALAAIAFTGVLLLTRPAAPVTEMSLTNPGPAIRFMRLSDGSMVTLDVATELTVAIGSRAREARLRSGRARFKVADDPGRPFIVSWPGGRVEANGSEFDVALSAGQMTVMARNGAVRVFPAGTHQEDAVAVGAGRAVRVEGNDVVPAAVSRGDRLWPDGRHAFNRTSLATILALANRLGGPPIKPASEAIGSLKITAVLDLRDSRALARKLAAALDLRVDESAGEIVLSR